MMLMMSRDGFSLGWISVIIHPFGTSFTTIVLRMISLNFNS